MNPSKRGRLKEKADARLAGGQTTINSGTHWTQNGDWQVGNFVMDSKSTEQYWFTISTKIWKKIIKEASNERKKPGLVVGFGKFNRLKVQHEYEVVIIQAGDFDFSVISKKKMRELTKDILTKPTESFRVTEKMAKRLFHKELSGQLIKFGIDREFNVLLLEKLDFMKYCVDSAKRR